MVFEPNTSITQNIVENKLSNKPSRKMVEKSWRSKGQEIGNLTIN